MALVNELEEHGATTPEQLGMNWNVDAPSTSKHMNFIRSVDWQSSIGHPDTWTEQLHESVDFLLADPTPAAIMWGDDLIMIYNERFIDFAGTKHPRLMGSSPRKAYAEVWDMFESIIQRGRRLGHATRHKDVQLFLRRRGFLEEVYVTYTFVPILDIRKAVVGFYHTAVETTKQVLAERRTKTLLEMGGSISTSRSLAEYWVNVLRTIDINKEDTPYMIAYAFSDGEDTLSTTSSHSEHTTASSPETRVPRSARLIGAAGDIGEGAPHILTYDNEIDDDFMNAIKAAITTGELKYLRTDHGWPAWLTPKPSPTDQEGILEQSALILPIRPTTTDDSTGLDAIGFLILGLNSCNAYDKDYEQFVQLFSRQIANSAASTMLLEQEVLRQRKLAADLSVAARHAQELERKFSRFAEISEIGIWICAPDGELLYANKAWYAQADIPDQTPMDLAAWMPLVSEESLQTFPAAWERMTKEYVPLNLECQFKKPWRARDPATDELLVGQTWFLISGNPEFGEDGSLQSIWGSNIDISYQKWAQSIKDERINDVLEAKRQTENFIDMTSHEMRNPLSAILQCADGIQSTLDDALDADHGTRQLVLDTASADFMLDSAATIMTCAQHQKRIVDDILTLSKLDASLLLVTPVAVDPVETVRRALQLHQQEFREAKIATSVVVHDSYRKLDIDKAFLDPSRLLQVLINLLTNAIKFTRNQSIRKVTLRVGASSDAPDEAGDGLDYLAPRTSRAQHALNETSLSGETLYLDFSVEDTGCGLNNEETRRLFARFAQASPKTHVRYGGSGLGLFICKELTELQGGRIGVSSVPGQGSTFKFYIKAQRAPSADTSSPKIIRRPSRSQNHAYPTHMNGTSSSTEANDLTATPILEQRLADIRSPPPAQLAVAETLHILLVEDNLINQKVMSTQLRKAGCIVHTAEHGGHALTFLKKTTFAKDCLPGSVPLSIVLMDMEMPVMDGLECVTQIREWQQLGELKQRLPVIAVTANARPEQVQKALDHGMDSVVTKPFRIKELIPQCHSLIMKMSQLPTT